MFTAALASLVLLGSLYGTKAAAILEARGNNLCPGYNSTLPVTSHLQLVDPTGTTSYGFLTPGNDAKIATPSYGLVSPNAADGLYFVEWCDDTGGKTTTITAWNVQKYPGTAIGLVAPYTPNGGSPVLSAGSSNWAYLAPTTYTAPATPPAKGYPPETDSWFESTVWKRTCQSPGPGPLKCFFDPVWTNPDGTQVALTLAAVPGAYLMATGDFNAFVAEYGYIGNLVRVRIATA